MYKKTCPNCQNPGIRKKNPCCNFYFEQIFVFCMLINKNVLEWFLLIRDFSNENFSFGFLNFYIAERITLKAALTSFIKHLLLTLFVVHRGLLMGRIKKKQLYSWNIYAKIEKFCHTGSLYKNLMQRYFALKIGFLIFRRPQNLVRKVS